MTGRNFPDIDSFVDTGKSEFLQQVLDRHNVVDEMAVFPPELVENFRRQSRMMRQGVVQRDIITMSGPTKSDGLFKFSKAIREHADNCWLWVQTDQMAGDTKITVTQTKKRADGHVGDLVLATCLAFQQLVQPVKVVKSRNQREGRYAFKSNGRHTRKGA